MSAMHTVAPLWSAVLSLIILCAVVSVSRLSPRALRLMGGASVAVALAVSMLWMAVPLDCDPTWYCVYLWLCCLERL